MEAESIFVHLNAFFISHHIIKEIWLVQARALNHFLMMAKFEKMTQSSHD